MTPTPAFYCTAALARSAAGEVVLTAELATRAKACILDGVALGIFGASEPAIETLERALSGIGSGGGRSSVFSRCGRLAALDAAMINGAAIHAIDYDDTYGPGLAHLTAAVLPAALAAGELGGASGRQVIEAYVVGYEGAALIARASDARAMAARGFHPTGCYGHFGAAMAAGRILGLDEEAMERALGLAATQAAGLMANVGTMAKPLHAGRAAANGVLAAVLAKNGFTCAKETMEGPSGIQSYTGTWKPDVFGGETLFGTALRDTTLKPYPSCWLTHGAVEAAAAFWPDDVEPTAVTRVQVEVSPYAASVCDRPQPKSWLDAKFSLQYVVAVALVRGRLDISDFAAACDASLPEPELRACVEIHPRGELRDNAAIVRVLWESGRMREASVEHPRGTPQRPLDPDALAAKVSGLLAERGVGELASPLIACVRTLEDEESLGRLMALCRSAGRPKGALDGDTASTL